MNDCSVQVIAVHAAFRGIELGEHLIGVAHIEIRPESELTPLLLELPLHFAHVAEGLRELARTSEGPLILHVC